MTYSYDVFSSEFASLCQSQIKLLTKGLGAIWSAVYLTEKAEQEHQGQLALFAVEPQAEGKLPTQIQELELQETLQQLGMQPQIEPGYLLTEKSQEDIRSAIGSELEPVAGKQLILPLVHEEVMMGLLITVREDRFWQSSELEQIKAIAKTLALSCFLEKQSQWYRRQLQLKHNLHHWEQEQLGNLLHQLRNPLTALQTFSKLLIKRILPEDNNRGVVESISRESDRLRTLIDRFAEEVDDSNEPLTLSTTSVSIEEGASANFLLPARTLQPQPVDIAEILKPLLDTARAIADNKDIQLDSDLSENLPLVRGDISALREVLNNLLDNAIKYTPDGGKVTVRIIHHTQQLGIAIEDTGYGIPEADLEHLFERHYRGVQERSEIPGTGLGLAIAKDLVEQMQGDIEVVSPNPRLNDSQKKGTVFTVWLAVA